MRRGLPIAASCSRIDLDEYTIQSMLEEGADVMSFGVGTKLASAL